MKEILRNQSFAYTFTKDYNDTNVCLVRCFAVRDGEDAGYISFEQQYKKMKLRKIFVKPTYRKMYIGQTLLSIMEDYAKSQGIYRIEGKFFPSVKGARTFYNKCGYFVPNEKQDWETYDDTWTLSKDLDRNLRPKINFNFVQEREL